MSQGAPGLLPIISQGEQNTPPQNVSLWDVDYFQLKTIRAQQIQEQILTAPSSA